MMPKGMLRWHLRNRIQMYRLYHHLTLQQLADRLRVSRTQVANWESDVHRPPEDMVYKLARILHCRPHDLFPFDW